jgi:hypothetical protein
MRPISLPYSQWEAGNIKIEPIAKKKAISRLGQEIFIIKIFAQLGRRDDAGRKIAHKTNDTLTLPGHARTPSGCKSGDIKRTIIKKCDDGEWCAADVGGAALSD